MGSGACVSALLAAARGVSDKLRRSFSDKARTFAQRRSFPRLVLLVCRAADSQHVVGHGFGADLPLD